MGIELIKAKMSNCSVFLNTHVGNWYIDMAPPTETMFSSLVTSVAQGTRKTAKNRGATYTPSDNLSERHTFGNVSDG